MSALGHEPTSRHVRVMSVIPLKADIHQRGLHVRLVPEADTARRDEGVAVGRSNLIASPLREEDARNNAAGSQSICLTLTHGSTQIVLSRPTVR